MPSTNPLNATPGQTSPTAAPAITPAPAVAQTQVANASLTKAEQPAAGLVSNNVSALIDQNSPLMQRAAAKAAEQSNARGMLNSSMAVGDAQNAVIANATPIAQSDAASTNQFALTNAQSANQNAQFNAGAANTVGTANTAAANTAAQNTQQIGATAALQTQQIGATAAQNTQQQDAQAALQTQQIDATAVQNTQQQKSAAAQQANQLLQQAALQTQQIGATAAQNTQQQQSAAVQQANQLLQQAASTHDQQVAAIMSDTTMSTEAKNAAISTLNANYLSFQQSYKALAGLPGVTQLLNFSATGSSSVAGGPATPGSNAAYTNAATLASPIAPPASPNATPATPNAKPASGPTYNPTTGLPANAASWDILVKPLQAKLAITPKDAGHGHIWPAYTALLNQIAAFGARPAA